ncbi:MAG: phosphoribosyl-AMP cyclohydrolase [Thioalkalivibrionaceae bacterium]
MLRRPGATLALPLAAGLAFLSLQAQADYAVEGANLEAEKARIVAAQQAWGDALLAISAANRDQGVDAARDLAVEVIDSAYAYGFGPVLFKPTLTSGEQTFRTSREGAIAYFVGGDSAFPDDSGFALKDWVSFSIDNAAMWISDGKALTMGHVHLTDGGGNVTTVEKTWGFKVDEQGDLRIVLHHSSLPAELERSPGSGRI